MVGFVGAHPPPACDAEADYGQKDGENDDEVNVAQHAMGCAAGFGRGSGLFNITFTAVSPNRPNKAVEIFITRKAVELSEIAPLPHLLAQRIF
jgi:hypothetical protein